MHIYTTWLCPIYTFLLLDVKSSLSQYCNSSCCRDWDDTYLAQQGQVPSANLGWDRNAYLPKVVYMPRHAPNMHHFWGQKQNSLSEERLLAAYLPYLRDYLDYLTYLGKIGICLDHLHLLGIHIHIYLPVYKVELVSELICIFKL